MILNKTLCALAAMGACLAITPQSASAGPLGGASDLTGAAPARTEQVQYYGGGGYGYHRDYDDDSYYRPRYRYYHRDYNDDYNSDYDTRSRHYR